MQFTSHSGAPLSCLDAAGTARSIADKIAFGQLSQQVPALQARARDLRDPDFGRWTASTRAVPGAIPRYTHNWRPRWETRSAVLYVTTSSGIAAAAAFFHNDAHYEGRLFGTWCIAGPELELVFPRASVRLSPVHRTPLRCSIRSKSTESWHRALSNFPRRTTKKPNRA